MTADPVLEVHQGTQLPAAIAFLVRDASHNVMGYCWRLWWGRTSFYLKPRYVPLPGLKVSMHGPDARHGGLGGFKVDYDHDALPGARSAGGIAAAHPDTLPSLVRRATCGQRARDPRRTNPPPMVDVQPGRAVRTNADGSQR